MSLALPILDTQPQRPAFAQGPRRLEAVRLLRISVTDRCNLRCQYCMPAEGVAFEDKDDLLRPADFEAVAAAAHRAGVRHWKLTGGEPTVRADLPDIIGRLARLGPEDLSMTTNGLTLARLAQPLRRAGLMRVTVSWDSMVPARAAQIAGADPARGDAMLDQLRRGLDAAEQAGLRPIKINMVVIRGVNDDEVARFARLTLDKPWTVRFIESMPLGRSQFTDAGGVDHGWLDNSEVKARIAAELNELIPVSRQREIGVGPAEVYRLSNAVGRVGFISAMSQPFCETCNRLRLTARGELRACLFDGGEVDLLSALHPTPNPRAILAVLHRCVALKPDTRSSHGNRAMSQLGG